MVWRALYVLPQERAALLGRTANYLAKLFTLWTYWIYAMTNLNTYRAARYAFSIHLRTARHTPYTSASAAFSAKHDDCWHAAAKASGAAGRTAPAYRIASFFISTLHLQPPASPSNGAQLSNAGIGTLRRQALRKEGRHHRTRTYSEW